MPTVETNGIATYYERQGSGPPIVFVHAMYMNASQWDPQVEALAEDYTTITYDVRGHGRTGGSDRERYDMALYADDLDALLETLAVEQPILCGLSMGGCIAQVYAATNPESLAGLVLADTFAARPLPLSARLLFANVRTFALLDNVVRYPTLNKVQLLVGDLLSPGVSGDRTRIQAVLEATPTIPHDEFVKIARSMAAFPDADVDLSKIDRPTLLMHGEHLPSVMRDMHPRLAEQLTNAHLETAVVPGSGHASNVDNPAYFTDRVREFADACQDRDESTAR